MLYHIYCIDHLGQYSLSIIYVYWAIGLIQKNPPTLPRFTCYSMSDWTHAEEFDKIAHDTLHFYMKLDLYEKKLKKSPNFIPKH